MVSVFTFQRGFNNILQSVLGLSRLVLTLNVCVLFRWLYIFVQWSGVINSNINMESYYKKESYIFSAFISSRDSIYLIPNADCFKRYPIQSVKIVYIF